MTRNVLDISMDVIVVVRKGRMRVCTDDWFADVPSTCGWVRDASTRVSVVRRPDGKETVEERLELSGQVLVRNEERVVISCGGLIASVVPTLVASDVTRDATVIFTRL